MGRLEAPPQFRNSTATSDDGISLYTQQSEDEMNDTPPSYSDASGSASEPLLPVRPASRTTRQHNDPRPFKQYEELEMIMDERFDNDPVYAEEMVREWCAFPAAAFFLNF